MTSNRIPHCGHRKHLVFNFWTWKVSMIIKWLLIKCEIPGRKYWNVLCPWRKYLSFCKDYYSYITLASIYLWKTAFSNLSTLKTHAHLDLEVKLNKSTIKPWMDASIFAAWLQDNLSHYNIKNAFKYVYSHIQEFKILNSKHSLSYTFQWPFLHLNLTDDWQI